MNPMPTFIFLFSKLRYKSTFTSILAGGGVSYAVINDKPTHIPLAIIAPGMYTGYQVIKNYTIQPQSSYTQALELLKGEINLLDSNSRV